MSDSSLLIAADTAQALTVVFSLLGFVPQWIKTLKTKSSEGVSISSWSVWALSSALGMFYAIVQYNTFGIAWTLLITTSLGMIFNLMTIVFFLYYSKPRHTNEEMNIQFLESALATAVAANQDTEKIIAEISHQQIIHSPPPEQGSRVDLLLL